MKNTLFLIFLSAFLISCGPQGADLKPKKQGACHEITKRALKELLSKETADIDDLERVLDSKSLDKNGKLKKITLTQALNLICDLKEKTTLDYPLPVFEIKDSKQWIIFSNSKGHWGPVWAFIHIDRAKQEIVNVKFDHGNEAPVGEVNFRDSSYSERFKNIGLNESNFNTDTIDGVTGATTTHEAYLRAIKKAVGVYM